MRAPAPHPPADRRRPIAASLALLACLGCGRGPAPEPAPAASAPAARARVEVAEPRRPLRGATRNEALAEVLTDWLIALADKVRIRDFDGMRAWLAEEFEGEDPWAGEVARAEGLPLGVRRAEVAPAEGAPLGRDAFVAAVAGRIGDWRRVTQAGIKLESVVFEDAKVVAWGRAELDLHVVGETALGGFDALSAKCVARLENRGGQWTIVRLRVDERVRSTRASGLFSEVSRAAGVAHDGPPFGAAGNDTVAWNGAAAGDVDGDGRFDLFVPSGARSFLYRSRGDGTFAEEAAERGLGGEARGTGAVFFDYDRDGDQDLAVAHVGWIDLTARKKGRSLALYENDGAGRFTDVTEARGMARYLAAYSLAAFDADGDGWIDLYVTGYGRMEEERNDSWIAASNGDPDLFLRNEGGRFADRTQEAGFGDRAWSHAAAAADYDEDGDADLFVANNFGPCSLWRNAGDGTFEDVARAVGVAAPGIVMGAAWADLDHDGRLDLYLSSPASVAGSRMLSHLDLDGLDRAARNLRQLPLGNRLFLNGGDGGFAEVPLGHGASSAGWSFGAAASDLDLDGALDVACANGFVTGDLTGDT